MTGVIMVAPMLSVEQVKRKPANRVLLPISSFLALVLPALPVAPKGVAPLELQWLRKELGEDKLNYHGLVRGHEWTRVDMIRWTREERLEE